MSNDNCGSTHGNSVERYLRDNADSIDFNETDDKGWNLVHHLAYNDDARVLQIVLSLRPALTDAKTSKLQSILHIAAAENSLEVTKYVLTAHNAIHLLNQVNIYRETAGHIASAIGKSRITAISMLIEYGLDLYLHDQWDRSMMMIAVENKHDDIVKLLVDCGVKVSVVSDSNTNTSSNGDASGTCIVRSRMADEFMSYVANKGKYTTATDELHADADGCSRKVIVKHIFSVTEDLIGVASDTSVQCLDTVSVKSRKSLSQLVEYPGDVEQIQAYLDNLIDVDPAGRDYFSYTALDKFTLWRKAELVTLLLPYLTVDGLNSNNNKDKSTALHLSIENNCYEVFTILIADNRIDRNIRNASNKTIYDLIAELDNENKSRYSLHLK